MLIFTLMEGESFHINDDVEVNVKSVKTSHVKVAVHAPDKFKISRIDKPYEFQKKSLNEGCC
jgi:carbon storage regulator CsrA